MLVFKYNLIIRFLLGFSCYDFCLSELFSNVSEKCYEDLGCVRITPEWRHPKYRPVNVLPADRRAVNTIFVRWHLQNQKVVPEVIGSAEGSTAKIKSCLKLLVHDFTSNGYTGWVNHLARAMLTHPENVGFNVVSVDWAPGAEPPYEQAVANARLVSLEIMLFLHRLKTKSGLDVSSVHIIGHGVGAHIAGYVGKLSKLRRITALDPSGPYFKSMPQNVRLHQDDADFVDVVHTNDGGQGNGDLLGHVDYFPNGGRKQVGCKDPYKKLTSVKRGDIQLGEILPGCSHKRSLKYFIESLINPICSFVGVACPSFKDFLKGKCLSCGNNMEYCSRINPLITPRSVNNTKGFYFVTSASTLFCGEMLKVILTVSNSQSNAYVMGHFLVTIPQENGDVKFLLNENNILSKLRTEELHVFLVFRSSPPALMLPATSIRLRWFHSPLPRSWSNPPQITSFLIHKITDRTADEPQWFCQTLNYTDDYQPCNHTIFNKTLRRT